MAVSFAEADLKALTGSEIIGSAFNLVDRSVFPELLGIIFSLTRLAESPMLCYTGEEVMNMDEISALSRAAQYLADGNVASASEWLRQGLPFSPTRNAGRHYTTT